MIESVQNECRIQQPFRGSHMIMFSVQHRGSAYDINLGYRKYDGLLECIQHKHRRVGRDLLPLHVQFVSHD